MFVSFPAIVWVTTVGQKVAAPQSTSGEAHAIKVSASPIYKKLDNFMMDHPDVSQARLREFANAEFQEFGVNFDFEIGEFIRSNNLEPRSGSDSEVNGEQSYILTLTPLDGPPQTFLVTVAEGLCGERIATLPVVNVTQNSIVLAVGDKKYQVQRPPGFGGDDMALVDSSMRKVLQRWEVPYGSIPTGVSPDGTAVYLDGFFLSRGKRLWLAISEKGMHLEPATREQESQGEWIQEHPTDPTNDYLSFMRFRVGKQTMIVRFSAPCT